MKIKNFQSEDLCYAQSLRALKGAWNINMDVNKLCMGCMRETGQSGVCPHCGYDAGSASVEDNCLKPYTILRGKYLVGRALGKGSFGVTYIGFDLNLQLPVAVKEFHSDGNTVKEDFLAEAKTLARCNDLPGIVAVKDFFEENATAYIVMEYAEGMTLRAYTEKAGGRLTMSDLLPALTPVMRALLGIHNKGLLHRDVSSDNIILTADNGMRLLDFGAAGKRHDMLKSGYAPEEQYRADGVQGPWTDIYALSAVIYQCITGVTLPESTKRVQQDTVKNPSELGISIALQTETALMKGMAVHAEDRFQSIDALTEALYCAEKAEKMETAAKIEKAGKIETSERGEDRKEGKKKIPIWGLAAAVCLLVIGIVCALLPKHNEEGSQEEDIVADVEPLYRIEEMERIDLFALNHETGIKRQGMQWDESLFYWLEDVDPASGEDGNIARCHVSKSRMQNTANGSDIEYEIYRDADTGEIYKIVGIEEQGSLLLLTDYYFSNGRVNFIFLRYDSVYTPTYATVKKTGERFYFQDDVLVRWRSVDVPGEIEEMTLNPREVNYTQLNYFAQTQEQRSKYDEIERVMLNEAYNVYEAANNQIGIGILQGRVQNAAGGFVAGRTVNVYRKQDDVLLYQGKTEENGTFAIYVYLDNAECYMEIESGEDYQNAGMQNLIFTDNNLTYSYHKIVLKEDDEPHTVQMVFQNAENRNDIPKDIKVTFREGNAAYSGEAMLTLQTEEVGKINAQLPGGIYTVQAEAEGYLSAFLEIEAVEGKEYPFYLVPEIPAGRTAIVLTWEQSDIDLDLTVFTPYQVSYGDMAHLGRQITADEYGNCITAENVPGCEVAYIDTSVLGSYKVYVNDYTNSRMQNYKTDAMANANVHIYIYNSQGLLDSFEMPYQESGVVWEVAQISGNQITAEERVYSDVSGKKWWTSFEP